MIGLLLIISILILNFSYGFINTKRCFWINYFILLLFPIGIVGTKSTGVYFDTSNFLQIGQFDIFDVSILSFAILIIFKIIFVYKKMKKINKLDFLIIILGVITLIYLVVGYSNFGKLSIGDSKKYIYSILLYFMAREMIERNDLDKFIKITLYSTFCNSILIVLIYIFSINRYISIGERYGFGCQSMYVITIPIQLYFLFNRKKKNIEFRKGFLITSVIVETILLALNQNRTNPIMIIVTLILIYIFNRLFIKYDKTKFYVEIVKVCFLPILFLSLFSIAISKVDQLNVGLIDRYKDGDNYTYEIRKSSNKYYFNQIKKNILGYGPGTFMPHILPDGRPDPGALESFQTDNLPVVIGYKFGIISLVIYLLIIIININRIIVNLKNSPQIYLLLLAILPSLLVCTAYMTSQMIHNICVSSYWWTYLVIFRENK